MLGGIKRDICRHYKRMSNGGTSACVITLLSCLSFLFRSVKGFTIHCTEVSIQDPRCGSAEPCRPVTNVLNLLDFLARIAVDISWRWNILWSDEAHLTLYGLVNTQNCRIWGTANPNVEHEQCRYPDFLSGPFSTKENTPTALNDVHYECRYSGLLQQHKSFLP
ncbi:hypothetical protein AVEN_18873-1 [Araneus ventricosus]|uniref:Uncharacterized protein n=1 Tax=Araneus ventricosus TaxID=182803 RepID=A0A4Y2U2Y6_ARAVE|nr:hypothetical protein AVEN_18873-1 [Araneus ventricosus]